MPQQAKGLEDIALFPLTIPFTTGPGTISVAVALGAGHPRVFHGLGLVLPGDDRRGGGNGGGNLGHLPLCRPADATAGSERHAHHHPDYRRSCCCASGCRS